MTLRIILIGFIGILFHTDTSYSYDFKFQHFNFKQQKLHINKKFENVRLLGHFRSNNVQGGLFIISGLTCMSILGPDHVTDQKVKNSRQFKLWAIPNYLEKIGSMYDKPDPGYFILGLTTAMYSSGLLLKNDNLIITTKMMLKSLIVTTLFSTSFKIIVGRSRPYMNNNQQKNSPFNLLANADYLSMPSGHTSSIFAMMTVIAKRHKSLWVKVPTYLFAMSVGYERIKSGQHWASDVLVGGTLGYLISKSIVHNEKNKFKKKIKFGTCLKPNYIGLSLYF